MKKMSFDFSFARWASIKILNSLIINHNPSESRFITFHQSPLKWALDIFRTSQLLVSNVLGDQKKGCSGIPVRCVPARYYFDVKDSIQTSNYLLAHDNEHFEISAWIKFSLEECHAITSKL